MASFTFSVESRPDGRIKVDVYAEADYPDALDDLKRRTRELHAEVLEDYTRLWGVNEPAPQQ